MVRWARSPRYDNGASSSNTVTVASTVGLVGGQPVTGTGVPANTIIASMSPDGTTFTLIAPAMPIPSGTILTGRRAEHLRAGQRATAASRGLAAIARNATRC